MNPKCRMATHGKFDSEPPTKRRDHNVSVYQALLPILDSLDETERLKLLELCNAYCGLGQKDRDLLMSIISGLAGKSDRT